MTKTWLRLGAIGAVALAGAALPSPGGAQTPQAARQSDWEFEIGAGAAFKPDYEGSDDYEIGAVPLVSVSWRDMLSLSFRDGLQGRFAVTDAIRITGGVGFWTGRDEKDNDALRGLGDLSGNAIANLGVEYRMMPFTVGLRLAQDIGGDREGLTASLRGAYTLPTGDRWTVRSSATLTWADDDYMQSMFGVTPGQAATSRRGYQAYQAEGGFKDVRLGVDVTYRLTNSLSLVGHASGGRLLGDAADSPLVDRDGSANQFLTLFGLSYRF